MSALATVLIPTHDHGATLLRSVASAREQTIREVEIFIVGDGISETGRAAAKSLEAADPRIRFFDNPKGERHGELHRHAALREARGRAVCYLSDDDLWLSGHVEMMLGLLEGHDFAGALPIRVDPGDRLGGPASDLALQETRALMLSGQNRVPLSCAGHTLDAYRKLPRGWNPAPEGTHTDLHMWRQFLAEPWVRARSGTRPTMLHFPTFYYNDWRAGGDVAVLDRWLGRIRDPAWCAGFVYDVLDFTVRFRARTDFHGPQT